MPHHSTSDEHGPEEVNGHHTMSMLMGRLLEGQSHIMRSVDRIDRRLVDGDRRMDRHSEIIARQDERLANIERAQGGDGATRVERLIARWLAYLIPAAALLATGSWDTATKLLSTLK